VIVDLRNIYRPEEMAEQGFTYESVGRPADTSNRDGGPRRKTLTWTTWSSGLFVMALSDMEIGFRQTKTACSISSAHLVPDRRPVSLRSQRDWGSRCASQ
jgi:hypothetical protein